MSTLARGNRLPMFISAILFALALVVAAAAWLGGGGGQFTMRAVPEAPVPDADSPATVLKTLSRQVETVREDNAELEAQNQQLTRSLEQLNQRLANVMSRPVTLPGAPDHGPLEALQRQLATVTDRLQRIENRPTPSSRARRVEQPLAMASPERELHWIEPLDADAERQSPGAEAPGDALTPVAFNPLAALTTPAGAPTAASERGNTAATATGTRTATVSGGTGRQAFEPEPIPFYTVPADSTLMDATAWTALLGRIPVGGQVTDPWRFKVLTGADNLAANGIHIPRLTGMIWSGIALGDLALGCVSGELYSVTFVFSDGRINTHRSQGQDPLAWISDDSGIPCVPGELKTNAAQWLATRTTMLALEAGAEAYADAETTRVVGPLGDSRTTVTGNADRYALGEALSGGTREARRWVDERQRQSFDAIFVPPGRRLTLNVETEIPIDYDPAGRKVSYQRGRVSPYRTPGLD